MVRRGPSRGYQLVRVSAEAHVLMRDIQDVRTGLCRLVERARARVLNRLPAKGARTVMDPAIHIAEAENRWVINCILGLPDPFLPPRRRSAKRQVLTALTGTRKRTEEMLRDATVWDLSSYRVADGRPVLSVGQIIRQLIAHEAHHTGQIALLLAEES